MTIKTKGRAGWHQAAHKASNSNCNSTGLKAFIVTLALWGWLPLVVADWFIKQGELRDE